jgi:hypothetical protein
MENGEALFDVVLQLPQRQRQTCLQAASNMSIFYQVYK